MRKVDCVVPEPPWCTISAQCGNTFVAEASCQSAVIAAEIVGHHELDLVSCLHKTGSERGEWRDISFAAPYLQPQSHEFLLPAFMPFIPRA